MKAAKRGSARRVWAAAVHTEDERQRQPANPPFSNPPACRNKNPQGAQTSARLPVTATRARPATKTKHIRSRQHARSLACSLAPSSPPCSALFVAAHASRPPAFLPGCPRPYLTPIAASTISGIMRPPLVQTEPAASLRSGPPSDAKYSSFSLSTRRFAVPSLAEPLPLQPKLSSHPGAHGPWAWAWEILQMITMPASPDVISAVRSAQQTLGGAR